MVRRCASRRRDGGTDGKKRRRKFHLPCSLPLRRPRGRGRRGLGLLCLALAQGRGLRREEARPRAAAREARGGDGAADATLHPFAGDWGTGGDGAGGRGASLRGRRRRRWRRQGRRERGRRGRLFQGRARAALRVRPQLIAAAAEGPQPLPHAAPALPERGGPGTGGPRSGNGSGESARPAAARRRARAAREGLAARRGRRPALRPGHRPAALPPPALGALSSRRRLPLLVLLPFAPCCWNRGLARGPDFRARAARGLQGGHGRAGRGRGPPWRRRDGASPWRRRRRGREGRWRRHCRRLCCRGFLLLFFLLPLLGPGPDPARPGVRRWTG